MTVTITPSKAFGIVNAPPSKSMAHRALLASALSDGSRVDNLSLSKDIEATLSCLKSLGADIKMNNSSAELCKLPPLEIPENSVLDCNESGSTLRFLIPLCLLSGKRVKFIGAKRLFERPLGIYEDICKEQGIEFSKEDSSLTVCGKLKSGNYRVKGDISSQFITGLLFALPLLDGISILEIEGKLESASYVDMTLNVLREFGIKIVRAGNRFIIYGNQKYLSRDYIVEGDCSNAAFLEALNFVGGNVEIKGLNPNTLQGDSVYKEIMNSLKEGKRVFDLSDCPDLAPILFAISSTVGNVTFNGTSRLKLKESDRALAMQAELKKLGISVTVNDNSVIIGEPTLKCPNEPLSSHNDHRIAMSLAVLATLTGATIENAEAVSKSYPDFFEVLQNLNIGIKIQ